MSFALNEIEVTAKKATRGASYSWGMAEESAKATRWLCAQGLDGCATLAELLRKTDRAKDIAPTSLDGDWQASSGQICALIAGATLSDCAHRLPQGEIRMQNVIAPKMLLAFTAAAARRLNRVVTIAWNGASVTTDGTGIDVSGIAETDLAEMVVVQVGGDIGRPAAQHTRSTPNAADWAYLNEMAGRTYAPATEESRRRGAGSGLSDND